MAEKPLLSRFGKTDEGVLFGFFTPFSREALILLHHHYMLCRQRGFSLDLW
jgi:hypothetical protein